MIAKFKIDLDDVIAVQSFLATKSKFQRWNRLAISIVASIALLIFNMLVFKVNFITLAIVSAGFFYVSYNYIFKKAQINQAKRLAKNNPSMMNSACTLTVSENGLVRELKNSTNKLEWNEIKLVSEDEARYLLYMSDIHVITIKKNPYNMSEEETQEYNALLRNYFNQHNIATE
ncbi:hypothetical protein CWR48_04920 [Oceanobacillus arenosus]|uniref:YcxB-like C-terminal domain-containing protein n=1 Tax=Oceanobacillus arenosus TaxID=1229153 RepID=A0A3D8PY36_9BACI|nr:YcxB family protein [Oceanobacillus arenosus]RDW20069.1 hypothetical protein CWR48_04920 [Oceanobacillus arenosus]